jgi:hypothetical protein
MNLGLKFCLELAAMAGFAVWGWRLGGPVTGAVFAVVTPAVAIAAWGVFAAPRAPRRLPTRWRVPFELGIFLLSVVALGSAGHPWLSVVLLIAIAVNTLGLSAFGQWEA